MGSGGRWRGDWDPISEQLSDRFDGGGSLLCHLRDDGVKGAGLERIVQWDGNRVRRRPVVPQPGMATFLTDRLVAEALQSAYHTVSGYAARQSHAASTCINSSFT